MRRVGAVVALIAFVVCQPVDAQRRPSSRRPAPGPAKKKEPAQVRCPEPLGVGIKTKASFCFVLAGRDPVNGVVVTIPPHAGTATLSFDVHNRHTYSEEEVRAGRGFAMYTAVVAVLSMKSEILGRGAVQTEFRAARDLYDRVAGGAGPGGVKAVAPLGKEEVLVTIPAGTDQVSLVGELLEGRTPAGPEFATPGRPVAIVSNIVVEYQPRPPARKR